MAQLNRAASPTTRLTSQDSANEFQDQSCPSRHHYPHSTCLVVGRHGTFLKLTRPGSNAQKTEDRDEVITNLTQENICVEPTSLSISSTLPCNSTRAFDVEEFPVSPPNSNISGGLCISDESSQPQQKRSLSDSTEYTIYSESTFEDIIEQEERAAKDAFRAGTDEAMELCNKGDPESFQAALHELVETICAHDEAKHDLAVKQMRLDASRNNQLRSLMAKTDKMHDEIARSVDELAADVTAVTSRIVRQSDVLLDPENVFSACVMELDDGNGAGVDAVDAPNARLIEWQQDDDCQSNYHP